MRDATKSFIQAGTKRKRSASGTENVTLAARVVRGIGKFKRHKSAHNSSEDDVESAMEVDTQTTWVDSDNSGNESSPDSCEQRSTHKFYPRLMSL